MKRRHNFFPSQVLRNQIQRSVLVVAFLLSAGLVSASEACAQDDAQNGSPIAAVAAAEDIGMRTYVATRPSAPTPKIESAASVLVQSQTQGPIAIERHRAFYWLDRKSLTFGLVQGSAEVFDGVTTRYF